ncbi:iron-sulfur cluster carrier protein ApbC [Flocculibacter collagenilyticus]|uniref:iron-sulfur cluster carrier protein ApbC n=1 Tax=Flocculibacter collagenilyticus TaxID=2744479 RepID=UPI0018F71DB8|nr:iron-sulfur cluster carrier protein ApbC [Flocculibacter collagenilyticus]
MNFIKNLFSGQITVPDNVLDCIKAYRSNVLIDGILPFWDSLEITKTDKGIALTFTLPFACESEANSINAALHEVESVQTFIVRLTTKLTSEPLTLANKHKVNHIILVASGKGGVGKSTTAVNLAVGLAEQGARVGLLDADIYGPSIPLMTGCEDTKVTSADGKTIDPVNIHNVFVMSIGLLVPKDDATVWRGPMASQALSQLINETNWPTLDYLIVDMPPGTGDIQLTMSQKIPCSGAIVVTTPQDVALADAGKGIAMFNKVNIPVIGLVENMAYYECEKCDHKNTIFGELGAKRLAETYQTNVLMQLPLLAQIRQRSDEGIPFVLDKNNKIANKYEELAKLTASQLYYNSANTFTRPEIIITKD